MNLVKQNNSNLMGVSFSTFHFGGINLSLQFSIFSSSIRPSLRSLFDFRHERQHMVSKKLNRQDPKAMQNIEKKSLLSIVSSDLLRAMYFVARSLMTLVVKSSRPSSSWKRIGIF